MDFYALSMLIAIIVALGFASESLARGTEELEKGLSQGIAGGLILGFLTSLPETIFVIVAIINKKYSVALGSAIGGNVILFTLGIGLIGIAYFLKWKSRLRMKGDYKVENRFLILTTVSMTLIIIYGKLNIITAIPLFFIYAYYIFYRLNKNEPRETDKINIRKALIYLSIGSAIIVSLSSFFINYLYVTAKDFGISPAWLALVITPIASELEEKISALRLTFSNAEGGSLAIVSFIGSKIENATVLLGLIGLFSSFNVNTTLPEMIAALIANIIGLITLLDGKLGVKESAFLIVLYFLMVYVSFIFTK
jgi:cation:H+ antiporter